MIACGTLMEPATEIPACITDASQDREDAGRVSSRHCTGSAILRFPSNTLDGFVESLQETGSVAPLKGSGSACNRAEFPKMGQRRPHRKSFANGIPSKRVTAVAKHLGAFFETARGQKDVSRNHNIVGRCMLNNPIICSIELSFDNHKLDPGSFGNVNPRVGNHSNLESVSLRHAEHFLLYGAAIGIDEYFKHLRPFLSSVILLKILPHGDRFYL
jgi:hypothetical protein